MGHCTSKAATDSDNDDLNSDSAKGNVHVVATKEIWHQKLSEANRDGKIVVANFSVTWCGPYKMIAPFYSALSEKHPSVMFLLVDVDELTDVSYSCGIKSSPTFFFYKNGQQIDRLVGANKPMLEKKLNTILDSVTH